MMLDYIYKKIKIIFFILLTTLIIERFIFSITLIQGNSMKPTLRNNDKLIINKLAYHIKKPKAGDIIIFHPPIDERKEELFIKRIIAVEGDQFLIHHGEVYINGNRVKEVYISGEEYQDKFYNMVKGHVPKNKIFVMGDNRNDSNDSRSFGFVPIKNIEGKADMRIWPLNTIKAFFIEKKGF